MIQKQIVDYAKEQIQAGVGKENIRAVLLKAGWPETDVNDSMASMESPAVNTPLPTAVGASAETPKIVVSELFSNSKLEVAPTVAAAAKEVPVAISEGKAQSKPSFKMPQKNTIIMIVAVVLIIGLAAFSVFLNLKNSELNVKLSTLAGEGGAANSKVVALSAQVATLTQDKDNLTSQLKSVTDENKEINLEFSFAAVPPAASSSATSSVSNTSFVLKGIVGGGTRVLYNLTTARGLRVYVKNSAVPKVEAALKANLGKETEISGTYQFGSTGVTVATVNGASVQ